MKFFPQRPTVTLSGLELQRQRGGDAERPEVHLPAKRSALDAFALSRVHRDVPVDFVVVILW